MKKVISLFAFLGFILLFTCPALAAWNIETVDSTGDVGRGSSVAVAPNGVIHIVYTEDASPNGNLKYAKYEGGSWSFETLDDSGEVVQHWGASIVLDSNSRPHIAYGTSDGSGNWGTYYKKWNGSSWESSKASSSHMEYPALTLDSNENPHITCNSSPNDDLHHVYWGSTVVAVGNNTYGQRNVGSWFRIQQVAAGGGHTAGLKSDGTVVAVGDTDYGMCDVSSWTGIQQIDIGQYNTFGLKSDGTVVATGYNNAGQLNVGSWTDIQQVDSGGYHTLGLKSGSTVVAVGLNDDGECNVGSWTNIQQVAAGTHHSVGLKSDNTVVAVGWNDDSQCDVGSWSNIQQVSAGHQHTVGLKSDGTVVAVGDNTYGQRGVSSWSDIQQVSAGYYHTVGLKSDGTVVAVGRNDDGECNVGSWTNIQQMSAGDGHTVALRPEWADETVDTTWNCGVNSSILIEGNGNIHISYIGGFSSDLRLRYAKWNGSAWSTETVQDTGTAQYTSIALDAGGNPCIAYGDDADDKVKYAKWNGSSWDLETIDDMSFYYNSASGVMAPGKRPNIAYWGGDQRLRLARWDGSGWVKEVVDANVIDNIDCSITIDSTGKKYIAYYDGTNGHLKLAKRAPSVTYPGAMTYGGSSGENASSVHQTSDGGFIVAGCTNYLGTPNDIWVLKLNADGAIEWQKTYGAVNWSQPHPDIRQTSDGGYILVSNAWFSGGTNLDYWIFKLNHDGTVAWQKRYDYTEHLYAGDIQQTSDGGYILAGEATDGACVLKLNADGTIDWQKIFSPGYYTAQGIKQTPDGGYIVGGTVKTAGYDYWVAKLNADGTVAWQKTYGTSGFEKCFTFQQTSDGGYIIAGETSSFGAGSYDFWVLKLNSDGAIAWQKTYGGTGHDTAFSIQETTDQGYVVAGHTNSFGNGGTDIWVLKLNSDGAIAWQRTYGGDATDRLWAGDTIKNTSDGGYVIAGYTNSYGAGGSDVWLLKLDKNGEIPGCSAMGESNATVTDTSVTPQVLSVTPQDTSITPQDTSETPQDTSCEVSVICESPPFVEIQAIPTNSARDWESFTIDGETYLAVANYKNDSTCNIDSKIYKWNGSTFVEIQAIPTSGAYDWESFTIDGETYLAVANAYNGSTYNINSKIYKWNGSAFVEIQAIPTIGAFDWESFIINGETYLAVANQYNGSTHYIDSKIYKWNGSAFVEIQAIPTIGAFDWESFIINGETYLAVANLCNDSGYNIDSKIYKWNGSAFVEIQAIPTNGAIDWESFTINGETYLAVANHRSNSTGYNTDSKIYKWNGSTFVEIQAIPTIGPLDWESFTINGETYLAVANTCNGSTYNINSKIYKWNGSTFVEIQAIPTNGANDWESFTINGEPYLAVANFNNDSTNNIDSKIYKYTGTIQDNQSPNTPSSPTPADTAPNIAIDTNLSWTGGDPDGGDTVTYDVYFAISGTTPLPKVATDHATTTYDPGTLDYNTGYDWKIISRDNQGAETEGPLWTFTTEVQDINPPVTTADPQGGTFYDPFTVTLSCDDGAGTGCSDTYYTTDGTVPTSASSPYSTQIAINENTDLKFFSVDVSGNTETVKTESYIIESDEQGPDVVTTNPPDGSSKKPVYMIQGTASDIAGVSEVVLQITDGTWYVDDTEHFTPNETWITASGTDSWSFNTSLVNWFDNTTYTITARATDNEGNPAEVISTFTYVVPTEPSTITCVLSRNNIILGEPLTISGQISPDPNQGGAFVDVILIPPAGQSIHKPVTANSLGEFSYDVQCGDINGSGEWTIQTSWEGDGTLEGDISEEKTLNVEKAESSLTLNLTSQAIKLGDRVSISGKFTPQPDCGGGLSGIPLSLIMTGPSGTDIQFIQTNDQYGHFILHDYGGFNALGEWTVRATFAGNASYETVESAKVKLRVVETAGYAIIVQGKHSTGEGLASHNKSTEFVYKKLKDRGLLDEDIMYFNYDTTQEGVDAVPTNAGIQNAISVWAMGKMNDKPANLYIIMVDHGMEDIFFIHPGTITAIELDNWLDTLQAGLVGQAEDQEIIIILGFCRSGSFIDDVSGDHRVIITSAAKTESSFKGPKDSDDGIRDGEYFVAEFFKEVSIGKSVKKCFEESSKLTKKFTGNTMGSVNAPYFDKSRQHPLLDDNADGKGSHDFPDPNGEGSLSDQLFIGVSTITGNDPGDVTVTDVAPPKFLDVGEDSVELWAKVDDNNGFSSMWVEVKPPDYDPVDGGTGQSVMELEKTYYTSHNLDNDRYIWASLGGFEDPGTYEVFYFAKDNISGNVSPLKMTRVYKARENNDPPDPFNLVSPEEGSSEMTDVLLDWEATTDPDGDNLTYMVLLSRGDDSFNDPIRKEGIRYSLCSMTADDGIEDLSDYYWKVQAIDEYGAVCESAVSMFQTDNTNLPKCFVEGFVYDASSGVSIPGATVKVGNYAFNTEPLDGYYLGLIDPGTYTFSVSVTGYFPKTYPGESLGEWGFVTKDFPLDPLDKGDINGDGTLNQTDVDMALEVIAGKEPSTTYYKEADVNGDGKISMEDVIYIREKMQGLR